MDGAGEGGEGPSNLVQTCTLHSAWIWRVHLVQIWRQLLVVLPHPLTTSFTFSMARSCTWQQFQVRQCIWVDCIVCGYGGCIPSKSLGAVSRSVASPPHHFISHGRFLRLTTISSPHVRLGTLHGMWIWRVHLAHKSKIGGVATLNGISLTHIHFPWQVPMLGNYVLVHLGRLHGAGQYFFSGPGIVLKYLQGHSTAVMTLEMASLSMHLSKEEDTTLWLTNRTSKQKP